MKKEKNTAILNHISSNSNLFEYFSSSINLQSEKLLTFIFAIEEKNIIKSIKDGENFLEKKDFSFSYKKEFYRTFNLQRADWLKIKNELNQLKLISENKISNDQIMINIFSEFYFEEKKIFWKINPTFLKLKFKAIKNENFFITSSNEVNKFTSKHTFKIFRFFKSRTFLNNKVLISLKTDDIKKIFYGEKWKTNIIKHNLINRVIKPSLIDLQNQEQALNINKFWNTTDEEGQLWWNFEIYHSFDKLRKLDRNVFKNMRIIDLWRKEEYDLLKSEIEKQEKIKEIKTEVILELNKKDDNLGEKVKSKENVNIEEIEEIYKDSFWDEIESHE